jgi:hypothetical protein
MAAIGFDDHLMAAVCLALPTISLDVALAAALMVGAGCSRSKCAAVAKKLGALVFRTRSAALVPQRCDHRCI